MRAPVVESLGRILATLAAMALFTGIALQAAAVPELSAGSIVNAADYHAGAVAPGEIVVLYPSNAGPDQLVTWALDPTHAQHSPDGAGGTRVLFDDVPARMVYARNGQICAIVPSQVAGRKTTAVAVEYMGQRSSPVNVPIVRSAPALFTLDKSGGGQAAILNDTGCCNSIRNPVVRGRPAVLYATGEGMAYPGEPEIAPLPLRVTIGGVPAQVLWARNLGVFQVNIRVPDNARVGDAVPVVLTVGGARSSQRVTMAIRSARRNVLVVSNEGSGEAKLASILQKAGYGVRVARSGAEAVTIANSHPVDLVVVSPSPRSEEMIQAIRTELPLVRTAALLDRLTPDSLRAADLLGAEAVLTRPLTAQAVLPRVRALLRRPLAVY
jgi:uncharacterized protein (TIGR03437 family)